MTNKKARRTLSSEGFFAVLLQDCNIWKTGFFLQKQAEKRRKNRLLLQGCNKIGLLQVLAICYNSIVHKSPLRRAFI